MRSDGKPIEVRYSDPAAPPTSDAAPAMSSSTSVADPLLNRILFAALLRREVYDEAARDEKAMRIAVVVVCLTAMARPSAFTDVLGLWGLPVQAVFGVVLWILFAAVTYPLCRLLAPGPFTFRRLLRCLGFAEAPGVFLALIVFVPQYQDPVRLVVGIWLLAASIVAVRSATGMRIWIAAVVGAVNLLLYRLMGAVPDWLLGPG